MVALVQPRESRMVCGECCLGGASMLQRCMLYLYAVVNNWSHMHGDIWITVISKGRWCSLCKG